jgi:hypothetical protein
VLTTERRRRLAPLLLVAAGLGAYSTVERDLPREHEVVLDIGAAAADVSDLEISWTESRPGATEARLTTRWHFAKGSAPAKLLTRARLPYGNWDAEVSIERYGRLEMTRWSGNVNLKRTPWWKGDNVKEGPVVLPVREALR